MRPRSSSRLCNGTSSQIIVDILPRLCNGKAVIFDLAHDGKQTQFVEFKYHDYTTPTNPHTKEIAKHQAEPVCIRAWQVRTGGQEVQVQKPKWCTYFSLFI